MNGWTGAAGAIVGIVGVALSVLARLSYRTSRDLASLAQRIAYLEGHRRSRHKTEGDEPK